MALTQTQARQLAKQVGGIARTAHRRADGTWRFGGWDDKDSQWVVETPYGKVFDEIPGD